VSTNQENPGAFRDRVAIVTGGTRGIGAAVSRALLAEGARVLAVYGGNAAAAEVFRAALPEEQRGRCKTAACDVSDAAAVEALFQEFDREHSALDILVNCAGVRMDGVTAMLPEESWHRVLSVNLDGAFHLAKQAILRMLPQRWGRVVFLTSPMGKLGWQGQANYAASKAGLVGLCRSLAKETAARGITCNCVSPGFIDTDFIGNLSEEQKKEYTRMVPCRRFGRPEEVACGVLYLLGPQAGYVTGTVLEIAGGL
jgi:3-oxoacyl-[acyl-carrier protein] reductase